MSAYLSFEEPPAADEPIVPSKETVAQRLARRPGKYAIVARADRRARAEAMVERINSGREYGDGFEALNRQVGPEHRVYARKIG